MNRQKSLNAQNAIAALPGFSAARLIAAAEQQESAAPRKGSQHLQNRVLNGAKRIVTAQNEFLEHISLIYNIDMASVRLHACLPDCSLRGSELNREQEAGSLQHGGAG